MTRFQEEYMQGPLATSLIGREGGTGQHSEHWWAWIVGAYMCVHLRMYTHTVLYAQERACTHTQCCMHMCVHVHTHNAVCARAHMYTHNAVCTRAHMYTHTMLYAHVLMYTHTMLKLFATSEEGAISCSPTSHVWPLFHIPVLETRVMNIFTLDQITIFQF